VFARDHIEQPTCAGGRLQWVAVAAAAAICSACAVVPAAYGPWGDPQPVTGINTAAAEGRPIESPDGLALYIASNRKVVGAKGKHDIYRARRASHAAPWGTVENLGAPVNTPEFDYCPTPLAGGVLYFVTSMPSASDCHPGDIFFSTRAPR
jgi:hypothetical protein